MRTSVDHVFRIGRDEKVSSVVRVGLIDQGRGAGRNCVPVGLAGAHSEINLKVSKRRSGPEDQTVLNIAISDADRVLPFEGEADSNDGAQGMFLSAMSRESLRDHHHYHDRWVRVRFISPAVEKMIR